MTELEELFVGSMNDLRSKIEDPVKYNNLKASAILRLLLIDGNPLIQ